MAKEVARWYLERFRRKFGAWWGGDTGPLSTGVGKSKAPKSPVLVPLLPTLDVFWTGLGRLDSGAHGGVRFDYACDASAGDEATRRTSGFSF